MRATTDNNNAWCPCVRILMSDELMAPMRRATFM